MNAELAARQAFNYAVDRATLIQLIGGPLMAQPTCQILPPAMPGYRPYCPYTINPSRSGSWTAPDLARAEQLVRASGTPNAAGSLWAHIDQEIVGQAPWVPVYNPRSLVVLSRRVGNYQFDPYWSVLIDQLWIR